MSRPRIVRLKIPKVKPPLNLPSGLKLATIRRAEHIPDSYVLKNYPLETYRTSKVILQERYPLIGTLIEQLVREAPALDLHNFDPEDLEDGYFHEIPISIATLRQALLDLANSPTLFTLFDRAFLYGTGSDGGEIMLRKEKRIYASDKQTIGKIKKKIYIQIQKYRHAKKSY